MGKMTIYALLIVLLSYSGCALMKHDDTPRISGMVLEEEVEMMDSIDDDDFALDPYAEEEEGDEPEPKEEEESDNSEESTEYYADEDDEPEEETFPDEAAVEVVPTPIGRMARLKRDCHMRAKPNQNSQSLKIQNNIGTRIWVEPENERFYRVLRRDSSKAYMWKHCFIPEH